MGSTLACNNFCDWVQSGTPPYLDDAIQCDAANVCTSGQAASITAVTYGGSTHAITIRCAGTATACCQYDVSSAPDEVQHIYLIGTSQVDTLALTYTSGGTTHNLDEAGATSLTSWSYLLGSGDNATGSQADAPYAEWFFTGAGDDDIDCNAGGFCGGDAGDGHDDVIGATAAANYFDLGAGNDRCVTGSGDDAVWDGPGDDEVLLGEGNDLHYSEAGADKICTDRGAWIGGTLACEQLNGNGGGEDQVYTTNASGADEIHTYDGEDHVCIYSGGATVFGQENEDDIIFAGPGVTTLSGSCGSSLNDGVSNFSGLTNCTHNSAQACPINLGSWPARP
jgi:hypothetical protein